jgi:hypothetical protein
MPFIRLAQPLENQRNIQNTFSAMHPYSTFTLFEIKDFQNVENYLSFIYQARSVLDVHCKLSCQKNQPFSRISLSKGNMSVFTTFSYDSPLYKYSDHLLLNYRGRKNSITFPREERHRGTFLSKNFTRLPVV